MAINIHAEQLLTVSQAARSLPHLRGEKPVHSGTIARWIHRGVRGVRLEAVKLGRTLVTSREALQRFAERDSPKLSPAPTGDKRIERKLDEAGL